MPWQQFMLNVALTLLWCSGTVEEGGARRHISWIYSA
jgi:hypothetical protein